MTVAVQCPGEVDHLIRWRRPSELLHQSYYDVKVLYTGDVFLLLYCALS